MSDEVDPVESKRTLHHQIQDAFQILQYNQQLIQFADSKAGTLIVINSLFIAAGQAGDLTPGTPLQRGLLVAYVLLSCLAVLLCLAVVTARVEVPQSNHDDFIFFADILKRGSPARYSAEFQKAGPAVHLDDVLKRSYVLAAIAARKFESYAQAQSVTALSALAWIGSNSLKLLQ